MKNLWLGLGFFIFFASTLAASSCATVVFRTGEPFSPGEAKFFDDGIDLIENLNSLSGDWRFKAEEELNGRVQLADLVAVVDILSVQLSSDVDGRESRRIDVQIAETLSGSGPDKSFSLSASEESRGFSTILRNEQRLKGRMLVFVRFFSDETGAVHSHFHLSPNSPALKKAVGRRVAALKREESASRSR